MREGQPQCAITSHRKAGHAAEFASTNDSVMGFDEWQKFADEEVVVAIMPIGRIDEKGAATFGRNHDEVTGFVLARQIFNHAPSAAAHKRLLVLAEPVQEIEHGIFLGFLLITRGEHHTIAHRSVQHMAFDAGAINAALGGCKPSSKYRNQEKRSNFHSYLRACTGSSFAARDAGYSPESKLITNEKPNAAPISQSGTVQMSSRENPWRTR